MPWMVTVLPVPVAPAIRPWRLARLRIELLALAAAALAPMKMPVVAHALAFAPSWNAPSAGAEGRERRAQAYLAR